MESQTGLVSKTRIILRIRIREEASLPIRYTFKVCIDVYKYYFLCRQKLMSREREMRRDETNTSTYIERIKEDHVEDEERERRRRSWYKVEQITCCSVHLIAPMTQPLYSFPFFLSLPLLFILSSYIVNIIFYLYIVFSVPFPPLKPQINHLINKCEVVILTK